MVLVLSVHGLTKTYGDRIAVDALDLAVAPGRVTGFVGPNGAGKTTTIRMLLGLVRPTAGTGEVLGHPLSDPEAYLPQVGALIEGPAFHPGLTARRNLRVLAALGRVPEARIDVVLDRVGLHGRGDDAVKTYSLGMRQRLGIAAALLSDPRLIVLDEPTNGLDPAGIREIRTLLRELAAEGRSVLVSSHLLSEVEAMCDDLVLIRGGRLLFAGPLGDLLAHQRPRLAVRTEQADDVHLLAALLRDEGAEDAGVADGELLVGGGVDPAQVNRLAFAHDIVIVRLEPRTASLEQTFFAMTEAGR